MYLNKKKNLKKIGFLLQWKNKFSLDFVEFSRRALYAIKMISFWNFKFMKIWLIFIFVGGLHVS